MLKELTRMLKPGGTLVAVVSSDSNAPGGRPSLDADRLSRLMLHFFEDVVMVKPDGRGAVLAICRNQQSVRYPRVIAQMRIMNEGRWIRDVLDSIAAVADGIVIVDDGSTDSTPEICRSHPAVLDYYWQNEPVKDQVRDKNRHLQMALAFRPDWVLGMDGDELLEDSAPERIFEAIRTCPPDVCTLDLEFLYMWNDLRHYRTDGVYGRIFHHRLFTLHGQDVLSLKFQSTKYRGNGHCQSVPGNLRGRTMEIDVKVKHLGYMPPDVRQQRYERYRQRDPEEFATGYYNHLLDQPDMIVQEWNERPLRTARLLADAAESGDTTSSSAVKQQVKPDYYYANARQNLVDQVPLSARRVLDVGCGQGHTGGLLRRQRGLEVIGIEIHPSVAAEAEHHLDRVLIGDVETMELPFEESFFDCIILGDILEHLTDPWNTLKKLARYLNPKGTVVASIPNIRNLGVIGKLLEGSWTYEEWGILDKTHLRFFALKDMQALFEQAGIEARVVEVVRDPLFEKAMQTPPRDRKDLDLGALLLRSVSPTDLDELTAQQFIFTGTLKAEARTSRATPTARPQPEPEASVIIPVYNNLSYTRQCITSIFTVKEPVNFEVIVVDDGSSDGTADYLRQLPAVVRVVTLPENRGFAKACNAGAESARGRYLVFLNNDTVVLPGWLSEMLKCAGGDPTIGIVGNLQVFPQTGKVQQAGIVCGAGGIVYSIYNNQLPADHPVIQKPREFQFIAGSCLLIERDLFRQVGGFDESYLNSCEDVDLCMRVREAGRKVFYCPQSRILHFESKTVSGHDKNSVNYCRFLSRWGDKLVRDDLNYLRDDGFLSEEASPPRSSELVNDIATSPVEDHPAHPRVAVLTTYNQTCGLAAYAQALFGEMQRQGLEPLILAERTDAVRGSDEPNVIRCWTRDPDGGREIAELIRKHGVQVLHVNWGGIFPHDGWLVDVLRTVRKSGVRVVITFHSTDSLLPVLGTLARLADRVLVHHPQNEPQLLAVGAPTGRIEHVPMGMPPVVRLDPFECKLDLGWDPAQKVVSTFGFVEPHKGVLEVIEALEAVRGRENAVLHVLGAPHPANPQSQVYLDTCKRRARELNQTNHVAFSDAYLDDETVLQQLRASDAIVMNYLSCRFESSYAAMIALSTGRPVVASNAPTFDLPSALVFRTTESFPLPQAIYEVLSNPFIRQTLLRNVLEYEKTARWDVIARKVIGIYVEMVKRPMEPDIDQMHCYRSHPDEIYAEPLQRERVRWLRSKAEGRILEIGPANGYVSEFVGATAAVDIHRGRLSVAAALHPTVQFQFGDVVEGLPFTDQEFDQVHAPEILEHVDFDQAVVALRECVRVGKRVLVTLPNADKPDYDPNLVHNIEHRWLVNRQSIERLLCEAGCIHWELDSSSHDDFYLLDVRTGSTLPHAVVHERAARLPTVDLDPGPSVHIGVDVSAFEDPGSRTGGIGKYSFSLWNELMAIRPHWRFTLFGVDGSPELTEILQLLEHPNANYSSWAGLPGRMPDAVFLTHPMGVLAHEVTKLLLLSPTLLACSLYDLVPLLFPDAYLKPDLNYQTRYLNQLHMLRERCDLFFCISQATAQDLQVHLQIPLSRLRIVHAGQTDAHREAPSLPERDKLLARFGLVPKRFVLFVAAPDPRRNVAGMIQAAAAAATELKHDLKLVITAEMPPSFEERLRGLEQEGQLPAGTAVLTGRLADEERNVLYHSALALLHPSLYEGFGFPIIEAMSAGLPVIAGNNSAQAEIAGEAALLVNPGHVEEIAEAILRIERDSELRNGLIERGRRVCRRYAWPKVAEKTAIYLSESIARRKMKAAPVHPVKKTVVV
jgi:GT2 family glycosyltransferase/glycosyltransferase involved in cell wall biosynthesis/2-polyprenyl-3-methyl-5-hydroxy-6-metoxy-1,4-benzoquinol methylase